MELVDLAHGWCCLDDSSCLAELLEVVVPAAVQGGLCDLDLLWEYLGQHLLQPLDDWL